MSNLLEQAIIDANALRETALKSAKEALIDKYKDEFKETLDKLLEQEDPSFSEVPPEAEMQSPDANLDLAAAGDIGTEEPGGEAFEAIPSSFLEGDDEDLIEINFDKIEKQLKDVLSPTMLATPDEANTELEQQPTQEVGMEQPQQEISEPEALAEELELEEELKEEELEESDELEEDLEIEAYDQQNIDRTPDALAEEDEEIIHISVVEDEEEQEELDEVGMGQSSAQQIAAERSRIAAGQAKIAQLQKADADAAAKQSIEPTEEDNSYDEVTEEEIQELDEELNVDIDVEGLLSGYMGASSRKKKELRNLELAAARDEGAEEERKKQEELVGDLKDKLQESKEKNKKYGQLVEELKQNLSILKEHTEKLSISNAKLLYINKVFGNNSLNERQKEQIVESISKAESVLEAKTIYGTLQSTVQSVGNKKHKESLSEALNRGSQAFISRPKVSSVDDKSSERLKILAGIIKE